MKIYKNALLIVALVAGTIGFTNCGGATTGNNSNTAANNKPANTTAPTNAATPANTTAPTNTTAPSNSEVSKTGDSVGVPECDEYIAKYEACLTKIAEKAPQVQTGLKTAFEQQRNAFKQAAANPTSKATLPATCKQAIETSKAATASYACTW